MKIAPLCKPDFLESTDEVMLGDLFMKLRRYDRRAALIFRNKKYLGLVERKKLLKTTLDAHNTRVAKYVSSTPILDKETSLLDAAKAFFATDSEYLPVADAKKVIGVVYARDIAKHAVKMLPSLQKVKVSHIKLVKPAKIQVTDTLHDVISIMQNQHVDTVPVFEGNVLVGSVLFRDVVRKYLQWSPKKDKSARFNKDVRALTESSTIEFADVSLQNFISKTSLPKLSSSSTLPDALDVLSKQSLRDVMIVSSTQYEGLLTLRNVLKTISELEVTKQYSIRYVGLNKVALSEHQVHAMQRIVENACMKLQRKIKEPFTVAVHLRDIRTKGKQKEFDVGVKIDVAGKVLATEKVDWDLETVLHKCFAVIEKVKKK